MSSTAILLAAGSSSRMQGSVEDKVLAPLAGKPLLLHSIQAFLDSGILDQFTIVYRDAAQKEAIQNALDPLDPFKGEITWVQGGQERQHSVANSLQAQAATCNFVYIHDCARPLITPRAIQDLAAAVQADKAAVLAHPVTDTIKRIPASEQLVSTELEDLDRSRLWAMETPQAFAYPEIHKAYQNVQSKQLRITDDTAAAATIGLKTTIVPNTSPNPKITHPEDLLYAECLLDQSRNPQSGY
ncbi:MAG: 2-C-methyl-D-erythritol 4-phosphate cytidylyltransferase [Verrucomicrobiota bacterium]